MSARPRYCKREEAEADRSRAIELAESEHDKEAVDSYNLIYVHHCDDDHKGLLK
jgi:hypothetical protein